MEKVVLELSTEQADVVRDALDLYNRLLLGQLGEVAALARRGMLPCAPDHGRRPEPAAVAALAEHLDRARGVLGFGRGEWLGVGDRALDPAADRAYEVHKVLAKAIADRRSPGGFKGVDHDGLTVRYTKDPAPVARLVAA